MIVGYDEPARSIVDSLRIGDVPAVIVEKDEAAAMQACSRTASGSCSTCRTGSGWCSDGGCARGPARSRGSIVVGIEETGGGEVRPGPDHVLREGDRVMLIGGVKELKRAIRLM